MGFIENIQGREDLNDEQKQQLIAEFSGEVDPLREQNTQLVAQGRRESVETEVQALKTLFSDDDDSTDAVGLLKFYRRALLSDDQQPGTVLLSDEDMGLTGDNATGATGRQEMSVAGALREFVKLMPRNAAGKLDVNLSDMVAREGDEDRPKKGNDKDERSAEARENLGRITGRTVERTRSRYQRGSNVGVTS